MAGEAVVDIILSILPVLVEAVVEVELGLA
jgi:hypothetical protein